MPTEAQEAQAAYLRDHWDAQGRAVAYLLTAHGAVLLGCLAALKDYTTTPILKGLGSVVALSAIGLITAALSYGAVTVCRSLQIKKARGTSTNESKPIATGYKVLFFISGCLFIVELCLVAIRLSHL
jgi:glucan phosphoethanolaminetransferase (alkaline phosphatase superfamily)